MDSKSTNTALLRILTLGLLYEGAVFCSNGMDYFYKELKRFGYIYYTTPMEHAGTGTLVGGGPKTMSMIANPETCFPSAINGVPTEFRFRDETVLPAEYKNRTVDVMANAQAFEYLAMASPSIRGVFKDSNVQRVSIEFNGVHIEYIDMIKLVDFYRNHMPDICKDYLNRVPFIIEAIKADEVRFKFYNKNNGSIALDARKIKEILDISANAQWMVEDGETLVITTPKYLGYQLGSLLQKDNGLSLQRATSLKINGDWDFKSIQIFGKDQNQSSIMSTESEDLQFDADPSLFSVPLDDLPLSTFAESQGASLGQ